MHFFNTFRLKHCPSCIHVGCPYSYSYLYPSASSLDSIFAKAKANFLYVFPPFRLFTRSTRTAPCSTFYSTIYTHALLQVIGEFWLIRCRKNMFVVRPRAVFPAMSFLFKIEIISYPYPHYCMICCLLVAVIVNIVS